MWARAPRTYRAAMSDYMDVDGDGHVDRVDHEQYGDGTSAAVVDLNGDGRPDLALYDLNGDGQADYVRYDADGDGIADVERPTGGGSSTGYADGGYAGGSPADAYWDGGYSGDAGGQTYGYGNM